MLRRDGQSYSIRGLNILRRTYGYDVFLRNGDEIQIFDEQLAEFSSASVSPEVLALRGTMPGEYTVNLHYYDSESYAAVPVSVKVARVNPVYEVAYYGTTTLEEKGMEKTAVRFTILPDGSVGNLNYLPKTLVPR